MHISRPEQAALAGLLYADLVGLLASIGIHGTKRITRSGLSSTLNAAISARNAAFGSDFIRAGEPSAPKPSVFGS